MKRFLPILLLTVSPAFAQQPGIDVEHYAHHLSLSDESNEIAGVSHLTIRFTESDLTSFNLDLIGVDGDTGMTVHGVHRGSAGIAFSQADDLVNIAVHPPSRAGETHTYAIAYRGTPADGLIIDQNKHGDRTFFGDNWPNRARHWIPAVDHPSDKATYEFIVTAPDHYQVVGPGSLVEELDSEDGTRRTHWETAIPIPTKVAVIGAARFAVRHEADFNDIPIQSWLYPQDREAGYHDFGVTHEIMTFFTDNIGPYPYEKLANVQSKTRYGGMENASNIFYSENAISGTRRNEGLVAHEIAHQWFGDSVTERDWAHIWLSEGFATYFTQLYFEHKYGAERRQNGMKEAQESVLGFYERAKVALVNPAIEDPNRHLNPNSYRKGAWVLHMLRKEIGTEAFWDGIRLYYTRFRDGNADSSELQACMEETSGEGLDWFFQQWLYEAGQPHLEGTWSTDGSTVTLNLAQKQPDTLFRFSLDIGIQKGAEMEVHTATFDEASETFIIDGAGGVTNVVLDPNTWLLHQATLTRAP